VCPGVLYRGGIEAGTNCTSLSTEMLQPFSSSDCWNVLWDLQNARVLFVTSSSALFWDVPCCCANVIHPKFKCVISVVEARQCPKHSVSAWHSGPSALFRNMLEVNMPFVPVVDAVWIYLLFLGQRCLKGNVFMNMVHRKKWEGTQRRTPCTFWTAFVTSEFCSNV